MPAEWEPHKAMWLAMPHDEQEWGDYFDAAKRSVRQLADALVGSASVQLLVRFALEGLNRDITQHRADYGDIWLRDTGPVFVWRDQRLEAVDFSFNGWGGKYVFEHDADVAATIATLAGVATRSSSLIAEGGALESNGNGTILSTRQCLLNRNRNPGLTEVEVETALAEALGCRKVIWLDRGLVGDHTDGHIDNLARFVSETTVLCMAPSEKSDPNAEVLGEIETALRQAETADGCALEVHCIPSPGRVEGPSGLMAASYCNFLIANECVVVPTFDVQGDEEALRTIAEFFPTRRIVPLDAYALLTGGGTVHCISLQEPVNRPT